MEKKEKFKKWETGLMIAAATLFTVSTGIYLTGFPLAKYLFGLPDEAPPKKIGIVQDKTGGLKRESQNDFEFREIKSQSDLFDNDTVVTDETGGSTLTLDDGGKIQMGPFTMVKLSFENQFGLNGINRYSIQVLSGQVQTQAATHPIEVKEAAKPAPKLAAKPPIKPMVRPSPTPTAAAPVVALKDVFKFVFPEPASRIFVPDGSPKDQRRTDFTWKGAQPKQPFTLTLRFKGATTPILTQAVVSNDNGAGRLPVMLKRPGNYVWEMSTDKEKLESSFTLDPNFHAIEVSEPLVSGQRLDSNELNGDRLKDFNIELSWNQWNHMNHYFVEIYAGSDRSRPAVVKEITGTKYELNKNKVFNGDASYDIFTRTPNGFNVFSSKKDFKFAYLPPIPVKPQSGNTISAKAIQGENKSILLTWQSTNFTENYRLEIATDNQFTNVVLDQNIPNNFYVFRAPNLGTYWWRVRSSAGKITSAPSRVVNFTFTD